MKRWMLVLFAVIAIGCGGSGSGSGSDGSGDGSGTGTGDGTGDGSGTGDGAVAQCSNGIDDDGDGAIDGFDPECTGPLDNREDSFATGIPGDNIDAVKQDCFFDGDSGHGNDGCLMHTCCLLDGPCPPELKPEQYDPNDCVVAQDCIDFCAPITPPGCDCFGCCTICNDDGCFDILTNPEVAPDCTAADAGDPDKCPACTPVQECGGSDEPCYELECQLCPGQTLEDLPESCGNMNECPGGLMACADTSECESGKFCSNGCCINVVQ